MNPFDAIVESVRSQLSGSETSGELETLLTAAGIPESMFAELTGRLKPVSPPPPPDAAVNTSTDFAVPKLLVDWGVLPQVGHQSRPCFMILSPAYRDARLKAELKIDDELDFPDTSTSINVISLGDGQWEFHVSFGLTTNSANCRPGQYLMQLRLTFEGLRDPSLPRFFQSTIRLNIGDAGSAGPTLEIDGDGQSIVNLNGQDLRSFGRVVLRGNESGIINIQGPDDRSPSGSDSHTAAGLTYEYRLDVDLERQVGQPKVAIGFSRQRLETGALEFEDGRRVLLFPKKRATLGRSRDNDIVIRFLPRSEEHDALSRNISRTHLILTLSEDGLIITDESKTGTALDFDPINGDRILSLEEADDPLDLELGITQRLRLEPFLGRLQLFGPTVAAANSSSDSDGTYCAAVGETRSRLLRLSQDSRIDAARLQRANNLDGREEYVCLYRQALIGSSHDRCAITLTEPGRPAVAARIVYIGRTFWLENLLDSSQVLVQGQPLERLQLAPLSASTELSICGTKCCFQTAEQLEI